VVDVVRKTPIGLLPRPARPTKRYKRAPERSKATSGE
jgi:hypothetical protein